MWYGKLRFFSVSPDPSICFFTFIPSTFMDKIAYWTTEKFKQRKLHITVTRADVMSVFCMWFLMGLVKIPNKLAYFKLGLHNVLRLLKIEERDVDNLLRQ